MKIKISDININPERRDASEKDVEELAFSISEIGLLNPVTLSEDYTLIAGLHRIEAAKQLGWTEIECTITGLEGLSAELAELDENFARVNLSPLELGEALKRRKHIYEMLYPETKAGTAQALAMNKAKGNNVNCNLQLTRKSFIEDTADVMGAHPSTIARHIKIASELTPEAKQQLRSADKPISAASLKKISKLEPEQQKEAASLLVSGEIRTVDDYLAGRQAIEPDTKVSLVVQSAESASDISQEQIPIIMGMAIFTDGITESVKGFLKREETFSTLSREDIKYLMEMLGEIHKSLNLLRNMMVNCY